MSFRGYLPRNCKGMVCIWYFIAMVSLDRFHSHFEYMNKKTYLIQNVLIIIIDNDKIYWQKEKKYFYKVK